MAYSSLSGGGSPPLRKMSRSMVIVAACLLGVVVGLLGLNYWHTSKCISSKTPDEMEIYIEGIAKRLLQAESQTIKNGLVMEKLLHTLQSKLIKLEEAELEEVVKMSKDEAVRLALVLAGQPAPPMPEFELDPKFQDAEDLADAIDDVFGKSGGKDDYNEKSWDKYDDDIETPVRKDNESEVTLTDAEATAICLEWKSKYSVVKGVSWGNLPYDLQQKWLKYACDYHFANIPTSSDGLSPTGTPIDI